MYESRRHPPLSRRQFTRRLAVHAGIATGLTLLSLLIGMAGYAGYEHLAWRDAFLNSSMLLGGMGPVDAPKTDDGKLFAGFYALYAGLIFMISAGVMAAPMLHRMMHKFHWEQGQK